MTKDASFADGADRPVNLGAQDADDLGVLSALAQDSVFPASEIHWSRKENRFALLINRVRWEDGDVSSHGPERVQAVLAFENVLAVASQGVSKGQSDMVMSLLAIEFEETDAPSGHVTLTLAGDGAIRLTVEALEARLKDVTKPYGAPSGKLPQHPE